MSHPRHEFHPLETAARQRGLLLRILRILFLVLFITVPLLSIFSVTPSSDPERVAWAIVGWPATLTLAVFIGAAVVAVDLLTPTRKISTLFSIFVGVLAAIIATIAVGAVIDLMAIIYGFEAAKDLIANVKLMIGIALAYLCITTVLQTQDDFRLVIPYVEFAKQLRGPRPLLLDSSALIDARIVEAAAGGFISFPLVVPAFILAELQMLGDSQDGLKRARGRRGLDAVAALQRAPGLDVSIDQTRPEARSVDLMLVGLAKRMGARILTADVGLQRVGEIEGVEVLNLNDLATALRPTVQAGDQVQVDLVRRGEHEGQAVGYLQDGTMVVAEDGAPAIGRRATLTVTSTLRTSAGRLVFARLSEMPPELPGAAPAGDAPPAEAASDGEASGASGTAQTEAPAAAPLPGTAPAAAPDVRGPFPPRPPNPRASRSRNPRR